MCILRNKNSHTCRKYRAVSKTYFVYISHGFLCVLPQILPTLQHQVARVSVMSPKWRTVGAIAINALSKSA